MFSYIWFSRNHVGAYPPPIEVRHLKPSGYTQGPPQKTPTTAKEPPRSKQMAKGPKEAKKSQTEIIKDRLKKLEMKLKMKFSN